MPAYANSVRASTRKRLLLAPVAVAAGVAVAIMVGSEGREGWLEAVLGAVIGWSFVASGLIAWQRRPENRIGPLMVVTGLVRVGAEFCAGTEQPVLYPVGHLLHLAFMIAVGYVLLAFPAGRLDRPGRAILAGALMLLPVRLTWLLVGGNGAANAFAVTQDPAAALVLDQVEYGIGILLATLIVVVLVRRWRQASEHFRFAMAPVLWTGVAGFGVLALTLANSAAAEPLGSVPMLLLDGVMAGVAVAFLAGLLRVRLSRSSVAELVVELGETSHTGALRDALARALRDPSLALAYWLPAGGRYVDADGHPVVLPPEGDESRAVTLLERDGRRIGALVHDPALREHDQLVQSACAAAALALENERLQAELKARLDDLQTSRARIVETADEERRRIERNLHDGTQQRLVSVSMALGLAQAKLGEDPVEADAVVAEARQGLAVALEELRELSRGIHPGILTERGLAAAVNDLTLRAALPVHVSFTAERLPEHVEATAYYVISEALANVAKYAQATRARVRVDCVDHTLLVEVDDDGVGGADVSRGSGLRGLADRVEALGGRLRLTSPRDEGTTVSAEIPCA